MDTGKLYIVATPIGNMQDITLRALEVLKQVDCIAAEDTRQTMKLLAHFNFSVPLISYHEHSKESKAKTIIDHVVEGKNVALVSDGGTPLISDPGYRLIQCALEAGVPIESIPGPCAGINALVLSGLPTDSFVFEGFLSRSPSKRRRALRTMVDESRTIVFYESPHRLLKTLCDIQTVLGNRRIAVMREMTKKFEEHVRGTVTEVIDHFTEKGVKGEFVLVVEGKG